MEHMTIGEAFSRLLAACGAVTIIAAAVAAIRRLFNPAFSTRKEVAALKQCNEDTAKLLKELVETNKLLCRGMMELLDYTISGEGIEKIDKVKSDLVKYLTEK